MKNIFYIIFIFSINFLVGQVPNDFGNEADNDSIINGENVNEKENGGITEGDEKSLENIDSSDPLNIFIPTKNDYKVFKNNLDTINISREFSINDFHQKNFTGKDYFGKMIPNNIGKAFNELSHFPKESPIGRLLPVGKQNNFVTENDIRYFDVKTPTTEFDYDSGIKEGQALATLFTHSPNSRINYSIQYRGLRSLGRYANDFAANNSFVLGFSLRNKKNNYKILTHYAVQNIDNQENGGIVNRTLFDSKSNLYRTRTSIPVNLEEATSKLYSRRVYLKQFFNPFTDKKQAGKFSFNHTLSLEENQYSYIENGTNSFFSSTVISGSSTENKTKQLNLENKLGVVLNNNKKYLVEIGYLFTQVNYNLLEKTNTIKNKLNNSFSGVYANIESKIANLIHLNSSLEYHVTSNFQNPYQLKVGVNIFKEKKIELSANYFNQSSLPRFNSILNQSFYQDYNYYNPNFVNEKTQLIEVGVNFKSLKTIISSSVNKIQNHIYFNENNLANQLNSTIQLVTINLENTLNHKKFNLTSTLRYQQIEKNKEFLPLPSFIARSTLFYQTKAFKNNAEIQTGFNINYFSAFQSREISPLNNEFKLQNSSSIYSIGNTPMVDFFLNLKASKMTIFLKLENISSVFTSSYYVLPNVPYTDWRIRAGIKWYLFS